MIPTRRFSIHHPASRAAALLDAIVDGDFGDDPADPDPHAGPGAGEDDGDLFDALADLEERVASIERALTRARIMGEPTLGPDEEPPPRPRGKPPVKAAKADAR